MIARVELSYPAQELITKLAMDQMVYEQLMTVWGGQAPNVENRDKGYMWPRELLIDLETDGPLLTSLGLTFEVKNFKGCLPLSTVIPQGGPVTVQVQIPHVGLLAMNEVEVLENYCTEQLQTKLDQGWRILCVCPPNAARRPDYIVGRTKEA